MCYWSSSSVIVSISITVDETDIYVNLFRYHHLDVEPAATSPLRADILGAKHTTTLLSGRFDSFRLVSTLKHLFLFYSQALSSFGDETDR